MWLFQIAKLSDPEPSVVVFSSQEEKRMNYTVPLFLIPVRPMFQSLHCNVLCAVKVMSGGKVAPPCFDWERMDRFLRRCVRKENESLHWCPSLDKLHSSHDN